MSLVIMGWRPDITRVFILPWLPFFCNWGSFAPLADDCECVSHIKEERCELFLRLMGLKKKKIDFFSLRSPNNKSTYVCASLESTTGSRLSGNPFSLIHPKSSSCTVEVTSFSFAVSSNSLQSATESAFASSVSSDGDVFIWMFFAAHNFRKRIKSFSFSKETSTTVVASVRFSIWKWCRIVNNFFFFFLWRRTFTYPKSNIFEFSLTDIVQHHLINLIGVINIRKSHECSHFNDCCQFQFVKTEKVIIVAEAYVNKGCTSFSVLDLQWKIDLILLCDKEID